MDARPYRPALVCKVTISPRSTMAHCISWNMTVTQLAKPFPNCMAQEVTSVTVKKKDCQQILPQAITNHK